MKHINQSVEIWTQGNDLASIYAHIARCARVCYQSEKTRSDETEEDWVKRVILRHSPAWSVQNHLSVLEHGTVYLTVPTVGEGIDKQNALNLRLRYLDNPYSKTITGIGTLYITTNFRVIIENGWQDDLKYLELNPTLHCERITASFITDIGVSRELNRHRCHSISEESTRYCNYENEVTFIEPVWGTSMEFDMYCHSAEEMYQYILDGGNTPQLAREVLPLCTKTQVVHTAFKDDWKKFLQLRADEMSGKVHPSMLQLAQMLKEKIEL